MKHNVNCSLSDIKVSKFIPSCFCDKNNVPQSKFIPWYGKAHNDRDSKGILKHPKGMENEMRTMW